MSLFGTDGIRDVANQGPLRPAPLVGIAAAFGRILREENPEGRFKILIGEDGRESGPMIRFALSAGLMGEGIDVVHGGLMTTPALAVLTMLARFSAGIMISASHNPYDHNGIKIFGPDGHKIPDALEEKIEEAFRQGPPSDAPPLPPGKVQEDHSLLESYRRYLIQKAAPDIFLGNLRIVLDCANGGASEIAPKVLKDLGVDLIVRNDKPDGTNINKKCGSLHADLLSPLVRGEKADLGICLDGDGDRCILLDEKGNVVDGDRILMILARHMQWKGELPGNLLVCTVMSNLGLRKAMEESEVEVEVTPVGDRSVMKAMREKGAGLGGEQSGHVIMKRGDQLIGDGLVTAIHVAQVMKETGRPLSKLAEDFQSFPQVVLNVPVREKPPLEEIAGLKEKIAAARERLGEEGRVLLRYSGTEKLARVMVEGTDEKVIKEIAKEIADEVRKAVG